MDLFDGYNWTELNIVRVVPVFAKANEHLLIDHVNKNEYQLSVKFHGRTDINYDKKELLFDTGTILYLPTSDDPNVPYNKYIRVNGTGVCIFFTSKNPLPPEAITVKCAGFPLEMFSRVLNSWRTVGEELLCLGSFYTLLGELKYRTQEYDIKGNDSDKRLDEARSYIDTHVSDPYVNIDQLASFCKISTEYFRQCFQKKWGVTPQRYLSELKMIRARELLSQTKMSVKIISEMCGFTDANYFTRFFRNHEGISPLGYRQRYVK